MLTLQKNYKISHLFICLLKVGEKEQKNKKILFSFNKSHF